MHDPITVYHIIVLSFLGTMFVVVGSLSVVFLWKHRKDRKNESSN